MKRSIFALALALALPLSAQAGEKQLSYSYIEGGYSSTHFASTNFNGWDLAGSLAFGENWYGTASYNSGSKSGVDITETTIGLGWRHAMSDKSDFIAELDYINDDSNVTSGDSGYRAAVGFRGMLGDKVEGTASVNYTDVGDFGNGVGASLGLVVHLNETWGLYGSYDYSDRDSTSLNTWGLGVRASF